MSSEIRWQQRLSSYEKAVTLLNNAIQENPGTKEDIIKEGIIKRFEYTHELAWKVMKDYLEYEGISGITGSRSATREAFNKELIENGQEWMNMLESRNRTVHTYDEEILETEYNKIVNIYNDLFQAFLIKMKSIL